MAATLELVDRQRRDLVANVSHELRTPISALQAVLENLVDGVSQPGPEELRLALAQTERLGRLVNDLLDLSRVEEGVTPLRFKDVRLSDFLTEAVAQARVDGLRYAVGPARDADRARPTPTACTSCSPTSSTTPPATARPGPGPGQRRGRGDSVLVAVADDGPGIAASDRRRRLRTLHHQRRAQQRHRPRPGHLALGRPAARRQHRRRRQRARLPHPRPAPHGRRPSHHHQGARHEHPHPARPLPGSPPAPPRDSLASCWPDAPAAAPPSSRPPS